MEKEANAKRKGKATINKLEQFSNHSPHRNLSRYYLEIAFFRQQFCLTNNQPVFEWFVQNENTTTESKYRNCECDSEFFALFFDVSRPFCTVDPSKKSIPNAQSSQISRQNQIMKIIKWRSKN